MELPVFARIIAGRANQKGQHFVRRFKKNGGYYKVFVNGSLIVDQEVPGSRPGGGTNKFKDLAGI